MVTEPTAGDRCQCRGNAAHAGFVDIPHEEPSGRTLVPTSITTAAEETWSAFSRPIRPAATTTTSAVLVYFSSGPDLEWQTVMAASRSSSSRDNGFPTTAERPMTTTFRPASGMSKWSRGSRYGAGRGRCERGLPDSQSAKTQRVGAIDVLLRGNVPDQLICLDTGRQRRLEDDAVH